MYMYFENSRMRARERGRKLVIMAKNYPKFVKGKKLWIQECQGTPNKINTKKIIRQIVVKP